MRNNPPLNRALFWADIAEHRANTKGPVVDHWHVHFGSGSEVLWGFAEVDLSWLYDDLKLRSNIEDKQVALSAVLNILHRAGRLTAEAGTIRAAIGKEAVLLDALKNALEPPTANATMRIHRLRREMQDREVEAHPIPKISSHGRQAFSGSIISQIGFGDGPARIRQELLSSGGFWKKASIAPLRKPTATE